MKLFMVLIFCLIWRQETNADNYIRGKEVADVIKDGDIKLFYKQVNVDEDSREEKFPGPDDYSPFTITRVAVYDWGNSDQKYTNGGVGYNNFSMIRTKGSYDNTIGYDIWIFGKYTGDCLVHRTVNETLKIVETIKSYSKEL